MILPTQQVILRMDGTIERLAFGRHGGELFGRWVPVMPLAVDRHWSERRKEFAKRLRPREAAHSGCADGE